MSVYIIKSIKDTALAIGNNGSGFTLVCSDWRNMRLRASGMRSLAKLVPSGPSTHGSLDECIRICGGSARLQSVAFGSTQSDRYLLGFLEITSGIRMPGGLQHPNFANPKYMQWVATEMDVELKKPSVGWYERFFGFLERKPKTEAEFTATGSFTGDLLKVMNNPEEFLITAMETYASQVPAVRAVFEARDFGIAIGRAIEASLSFEGIVGNANLKITDFKKMETANKNYGIFETQDGQPRDLRKLTAAEMDRLIQLTDISPKPNFEATTLKNVWLNIRTSAIRHVAERVTGLVGGVLVQKIFPGATGLLNLPKNKKEWLEDFGRAASNEIQKKVSETVKGLL